MIYGNFVRRLIEKQKGELQSLEEGSVYKGNNMSVGIFIDSGRAYGPGTAYFKAYNKYNYASSDLIARIHFHDANYEYHGNENTYWDLNSSERKQLMKILNSPYNGSIVVENKSDPIVWDALIQDFNDTMKNMGLKYRIDPDLKMPDYTQLRGGKKKR